MASLPLDLLRDAGVRLDGHTEAASLSLTGKVASLAHSHATKDVKAEEWTSILADLQRLSPSSVPIGQDVAAVTISTQEEKMKASPKIGSGSLDMGANRQSLPDGTSVLATLHELRQIFRRLEYFQGDGEAFVVTQSSANDAFTRLSATVHALALQALLNEAHTSRERGWTWRTIHDETSAALWYFAQTLPGRCVYAAQQLAGLILPSVRHESATQNLSSSPSVNVKEAPSQAHGQLENVWSLLKGPPALLLFTLFPWSMAGPQSTGLRPQGLGTPSATSVVSKMSSVGINLRTVLQPDVGQSKTGLTNYLASVASKGQGFDAQLARSLSRATRETRRMLLTPGSLLTLPLRLIRDEARAKERALKNHTHELAMAIGYVAAELQAIGASHISASSSTAILPTMSQVKQLKSLFSSPDHVQLPSASEESLGTTLGALNVLEDVLTRGLTISSLNKGERTQTVAARSLGLYMPSPIGLSTPALWSRIWFKLIGYPLAGFSIYRLASANQATLKSTALAAWDTVKGLVVNWVFDPVANFVRTLQHGSGHAHGLTAPLSLESDQDSLARMVTAFAHDMSQHRSAASAVTSNLSQDQINLMSERVKMGDLSPVMTVYEEQLKSPVYNLLTGSLVRPALIQLQKAKVDLELAMNGIDRLLASQQLVLGAVGLSPALGILYIALSWFRAQLSGVSKGSARARAQKAQFTAWQAVRGIEGSLLALPKEDTAVGSDKGSAQDKAAYVHGALLLDLTALRAIAPELVLASTAARHSRAARKALLHDLLDDIRRLERASPLALASRAELPAGVQDERQQALVHLRHTWGSLFAL